MPNVVNAGICLQIATPIEEYEGKENRCAAYARTVAEEFGKYYTPRSAWVFAERNTSIKKIPQEHIKDQHYNAWWINKFVEEDIIKPGIIFEAYFSGSHWNNKSYTPDGKVWKKHRGLWHRCEGNKIKRQTLPSEMIHSLKTIDYTHLLCYVGKDCHEKNVCWHQCPYSGIIKQAKIRVEELEEQGIFIKEIIDVSPEGSEENLLKILKSKD